MRKGISLPIWLTASVPDATMDQTAGTPNMDTDTRGITKRQARIPRIPESMKYVLVDSKSEPDKKHVVRLYKDQWRCDCKKFVFTGSCRHLNYVSKN